MEAEGGAEKGVSSPRLLNQLEEGKMESEGEVFLLKDNVVGEGQMALDPG